MEQNMKPEPQMNRYFYIAGWILMALFAMGAAVIHIKGKTILNYVPPCMFHRVTGYYCPGCGGTRATYALLHGKIITSLYYHPIVVYGVVVGGWFMISQTIERLSQGKLRIGMRYRDLYLWIALTIAIVNCLVKNLVLAITGIALLG